MRFLRGLVCLCRGHRWTQKVLEDEVQMVVACICARCDLHVGVLIALPEDN